MDASNMDANKVADILQTMKLFNGDFAEWINSNLKSKDTINIKRYLIELIKSPSVHVDTKSIHVVNFYCNIQRLMKSLESEYAFLGLVVLEKAAENMKTAKFLVEKIRIIPTLVDILCDKHIGALITKDMKMSLYTLLENLTFGIKIYFQEPYVGNFISILVKAINDDSDEQFVKLALSVLVNFCFDNVCAVAMLLRTVNTVEFSKKMYRFPVLSFKLTMILSDYSVANFTNFYKKIFNHLIVSVNTISTSDLKHILGSFTDLDSNAIIKDLVQQFDFSSISSNILNPMNEDNDTVRTILILKFLNEIIRFGNVSIRTLYDDLYKFLLNYRNHSDALNCIHLIVSDGFSVNFDSFKIILAELISVIENCEFLDTDLVCALLQLLMELHKQNQPVSELICPSFFETIFKNFLASELIAYTNISDDELYMYILGIKAQIEFGIENVLCEKTINYLLGSGILSRKKEICLLVLDLAKMDQFPNNNVAEIIANRGKFYNYPTILTETKTVDIQYGQKSLNKTVEYRLNALIKDAIKSRSNNQMNQCTTSNLIELFEYKCNNFSIREKEFEQLLKHNSALTTSLTQQEAITSNELSYYQNLSYISTVQNEKLAMENANLLESVQGYVEIVRNMQQKHEKLRREYDGSGKAISDYNEKVDDFKKTLKKKEKELKDLQKQMKDKHNQHAELVKLYHNEHAKVLELMEEIKRLKLVRTSTVITKELINDEDNL